MNCYTQDSLQSQMHKWECLVVDIINNKNGSLVFSTVLKKKLTIRTIKSQQ